MSPTESRQVDRHPGALRAAASAPTRAEDVVADVLLVAWRHFDQDVTARRLDLATVWPTLSATDQEAISLAVWDGLSAPEAATVLGITATAFRLRISRARRSLRRHLDALDATDREHTSTTCPEGNLP